MLPRACRNLLMLAQICDTLLSSSVLEDEGSASHDLISDTAAAKTSDLAAEPSALPASARTSTASD
jgi:hypothetical protein